MRRFERGADGTLRAELDADEALLLQSLADQVAEVVASEAQRPRGDTDPATARLFPDAYPQDAEASAEFRRFTADGLAGRKLQNAETLINSLQHAGNTGDVTLDESQALAWLRSLTDIRLTIAARLGIETEDDDAGRGIDPMMRDIYDWLGFVQNSLVEALDAHE